MKRADVDPEAAQAAAELAVVRERARLVQIIWDRDGIRPGHRSRYGARKRKTAK